MRRMIVVVAAVTAMLLVATVGAAAEELDDHEPVVTIQSEHDDEFVGPGFPDPEDRQACMRGGWTDEVYQGAFRNQGECIRLVSTSPYR